MRVVCWFSCGATSAVAARLALDRYGPEVTRVVYCDPGSEHPDNSRFLDDVSRWLDHPIEVLRSKEYRDTWDVFERTRYLVGVRGARCTTELKKRLRFAYQEVDDVQVFGFDVGERDRAARFRHNNPDVILETPLIDHGLDKSACLAWIDRVGIELPVMYRLGYRNNNCIGCVKGQMGYWNKIRRDFPDVFSRMARKEREIGAAICKREGPGRKRIPVFLDELDPYAGRYESEPSMACDLLCAALYGEVEDK